MGHFETMSDAWPDRLDIVGLTYDGIADTDDDFHAWFERQKYSRQPYEQLATVLQARGEIEMATNVRYAEREGDRDRSYSEQRWLLFGWLTLLKWGIGYGYYPYYSLVWVVGFVLVGSIVLFISGEGRRNGLPYGVSYSFDLLLPIIRLREQHYHGSVVRRIDVVTRRIEHQIGDRDESRGIVVLSLCGLSREQCHDSREKELIDQLALHGLTFSVSSSVR